MKAFYTASILFMIIAENSMEESVFLVVMAVILFAVGLLTEIFMLEDFYEKRDKED